MSLQRGDVLIQGDDPYSGGTHALMWIDGEKPLLHSSNDGFLGFLAQSMGYIGKYVPEKTGEHPTDVGVYRYRGNVNGLAGKAAEYAAAWATRPDQVNPEGMQFKQRVLGTPFSARRLGAAHERRKAFEQSAQPVSVETIFRVLKAIARTEMGSKLSPNHGVSCSQFVVYCYQAASLSLKFSGVIPAAVIESLKGERKEQKPDQLQRYATTDYQESDWGANSGKYWRDKTWWAEQGIFRNARDVAGDEEAISLLKTTLQHDQTADFYKNLLPAGMNIDPLSYGVIFLLEQLKKPESSFGYVGHLHGVRASDAKGSPITWTIKKTS